jgi:hypothetical protein
VDQEVVGSIPISHPILRSTRERRDVISIVAPGNDRLIGAYDGATRRQRIKADVRPRAILYGKPISDSGQVCECLIMNLSLAVVRCRCREPMESKTFVNVCIDRFGDLRCAQVIWVRDDQVGLRFTEKITGNTGTSVGIDKLLKPISDSNERSV